MFWLPLAGFTVWRSRADRVPDPQACTKCGYDRRSLAADAKCPECGAVPRSPP
jgi:predicted Zn-ribbon and HTH transcriptional regulator